MQAAPYVALAESVAIPEQNRAEYTALLGRALAIDVNTRPEWRLMNLIMQRRARLLLDRTDEFFAE
jgi:predicted anti-sigma-YlaC factor YlaD